MKSVGKYTVGRLAQSAEHRALTAERRGTKD